MLHSASVYGIMTYMEAIRTDKVSVNLTPAQTARLDRYAARHRWSRSTAAAALIEQGLDAEDAE